MLAPNASLLSGQSTRVSPCIASCYIGGCLFLTSIRDISEETTGPQQRARWVAPRVAPLGFLLVNVYILPLYQPLEAAFAARLGFSS